MKIWQCVNRAGSRPESSPQPRVYYTRWYWAIDRCSVCVRARRVVVLLPYTETIIALSYVSIYMLLFPTGPFLAFISLLLLALFSVTRPETMRPFCRATTPCWSRRLSDGSEQTTLSGSRWKETPGEKCCNSLFASSCSWRVKSPTEGHVSVFGVRCKEPPPPRSPLLIYLTQLGAARGASRSRRVLYSNEASASRTAAEAMAA